MGYHGEMADENFELRRASERQGRRSLREHQRSCFNQLLRTILPANAFYADKLRGHPGHITSLDQLGDFPFTTKNELVAADAGNRMRTLPSNRTFDDQHYVRFHRTSGTQGQPLTVLDSAEDWHYWIEIWQFVLDAAGVTASDRACMAFSFGPFVGFWSAYDALAHRGTMVIPAGGMSTRSRLNLILESCVTVLCCTPTYAMRMHEVAEMDRIALAESAVKTIIVAGEPGGSLPSVRERIESAWGATVYDHSGATEVGPWGYADQQRRGLHVVESHFIAEFAIPDTDEVIDIESRHEGDIPLELILTPLHRTGMPVIRYRTGDLVSPTIPPADTDNCFVLLDGGVLGRADNMIVIRGVNVFPSSLEEMIRCRPEITEFQITATRKGEMDDLAIKVEGCDSAGCQLLADAIQSKLGLRVQVELAPEGSLPRFEAKSQRFIDQR